MIYQRYNAHKIFFSFNDSSCDSGKTLYLQNYVTKINQSKLKSNYFKKDILVSYYVDNINYWKPFMAILTKQGFLWDNFNLNKDHNFFLGTINANSLHRMKKEIGINKYQHFFFFKELKGYFDKFILYNGVENMKTKFGNEFSFIAETLLYPKNKAIIKKKFKNYYFSVHNLWLFKPIGKHGGAGIKIFCNLKNIKSKSYLLQKYFTDIHLIKNKKYDIRLYVLISGLKPLRIYLYKEGLVRIAARKYTLKNRSLTNKFIHLTNTGINKYHKDYVYPKTYNDPNANIWNLNTYYKYLKKNKIQKKTIFDEIGDIIIKSIISLYDNLIACIDENNLNNINFFNIFGFDILITDHLKPKLIEINADPSLRLYDNVDKIIKTNLFVDTLNIIGITPFSHKKVIEEKDEGKILTLNEVINNAFCELSRPRGNYKLIFPKKKNINRYQKFFIKNNQENNIFWNKILENE